MLRKFLNHAKALLGIGKSRFLMLCALLMLFVSAHAQAQAPKETETERINSPKIRALAVGFENDLRNLHLLDADGGSAGTIRLMLLSYSRPFEAPINKGLITFGVEDGVDANGITQYRPVASVAWAPEDEKLALIFIPRNFRGQANDDEAYFIRKMNMSANSFALGSTTVLNLSSAVSYVTIGEHEKTIQPHQEVTISEVNDVLSANMVGLKVAYRAEEEIHTIKQTRIRYLKRLRYLIILYSDIEKRRVELALVSDSGRLFDSE